MNKVLVVDDERIVRIGFKSIIDWTSHGFELVGTAKNGWNALSLVEEHQPDIVVTDLKMPQMDGLELIRQLKGKQYRGKIIALSNHAEYELIREAMVLGASDYLLKVTLNPDDLLEVLQKVIVQMSDEREQIEEQIRQEISLRERKAINKSAFLRNLLLENKTAFRDVLGEAKKLGIPAAEQSCFLIYIAIDANDQVLVSGKFANKKMLALVLCNIIAEVVGERMEVEFIEPGNNKYAVLIPAALYDELHKKQQLVHTLTETIRLYTNLNVIAVASDSFANLNGMRAGFEQCVSKAQSSPDPKAAGTYRQEIRDVMDYMQANLSSKVTLEAIARVAALNESYVCRLFKQETGVNIFHYLNGLRIEEAKRLILHTGLSVKEIASQVGIDNPFYFSRLFKKLVGVSPNQYKANPPQ